MSWTLANPNGFSGPGSLQSLTRGQRIIQSAGQVNDILHIKEDDTNDVEKFIVACPTSGVWQVFDNEEPPSLPSDPQPPFEPSVSFSMTWDEPRVSCLLPGPQHTLHVFAAGAKLFVTDYTLNQAFKDLWIPVPLVDASGAILNPGFIRAMALTQESLPENLSGDDTRSLVLACDNGVLWSKLPPTPSGTYQFKFAKVPPSVSPRSWGSVTQGTLASPVVIAAWGGDLRGRGGIFTTSFKAGDLVLEGPGKIVNATQGVPDFNDMQQTVVASCPGARDTMFAVAAHDKGKMYCVLRSTDSGANWTSIAMPTNVGQPLPDDELPCIAATQGPTNSQDPGAQENTVAIGWQSSYFTLAFSDWDTFSANGRWQSINISETDSHHGFHSVRLDENPVTSQSTLYICSDIGVTRGFLDGNFQYGFNRLLPNLQIQALSLNDAKFGLGQIAASTLYRGNAYCNIYPSSSPWASFREGNGRIVEFLSSGRLLDYDDAPVSPNKDGVQERNLDLLNKTSGWTQKVGILPLDGAANTGLALDRGFAIAQTDGFAKELCPLGRVELPSWTDSKGRLMLAVAGKGTDVYGLMLGSLETELTWVLLGSVFTRGFNVDEVILCVASVDGFTILVGTTHGHLLVLAPATSSTDPTLAPWAPQTSWLLSPLPGTPAEEPVQITQAAIHANGAALVIATGGRILQLSQNNWIDIPSPALLFPLPNGMIEEYTSMSAAWTRLVPQTDPHILSVCTSTRVFLFRDKVWTDLTPLGLPTAPFCTDVAIFIESAGAIYLYLATLGWSLWRFPLTPSEVLGSPRLAHGVTRGGGSDNWGVTIKHTFGDETPKGTIALDQQTVTPLAPVAEIEWGEIIDHRLTETLTVRYQLERQVGDDADPAAITGGASSVDAYWEARQNDSHTSEQNVTGGRFEIVSGGDEFVASQVASGDGNQIFGFDFHLGMR